MRRFLGFLHALEVTDPISECSGHPCTESLLLTQDGFREPKQCYPKSRVGTLLVLQLSSKMRTNPIHFTEMKPFRLKRPHLKDPNQEKFTLTKLFFFFSRLILSSLEGAWTSDTVVIALECSPSSGWSLGRRHSLPPTVFSSAPHMPSLWAGLGAPVCCFCHARDKRIHVFHKFWQET